MPHGGKRFKFRLCISSRSQHVLEQRWSGGMQRRVPCPPLDCDLLLQQNSSPFSLDCINRAQNPTHQACGCITTATLSSGLRAVEPSHEVNIFGWKYFPAAKILCAGQHEGIPIILSPPSKKKHHLLHAIYEKELLMLLANVATSFLSVTACGAFIQKHMTESQK